MSVARIQVCQPEMTSPSPIRVARSSATNVATSPTPPRNAGALRAVTLAMNGDSTLCAAANTTMVTRNPCKLSTKASSTSDATHRPSAADARKTTARIRIRTMGFPPPLRANPVRRDGLDSSRGARLSWKLFNRGVGVPHRTAGPAPRSTALAVALAVALAAALSVALAVALAAALAAALAVALAVAKVGDA